MTKITTFFREVRAEMTKVVWPSSQQLVTYTFVVLGMSIGLALFLGLLDLGFQTILTKYLL